jgi:hypothetical protein
MEAPFSQVRQFTSLWLSTTSTCSEPVETGKIYEIHLPPSKAEFCEIDQHIISASAQIGSGSAAGLMWDPYDPHGRAHQLVEPGIGPRPFEACPVHQSSNLIDIWAASIGASLPYGEKLDHV